MRTIKMKPAIKELSVDKKYDTIDEGGESGHSANEASEEPLEIGQGDKMDEGCESGQCTDEASEESEPSTEGTDFASGEVGAEETDTCDEGGDVSETGGKDESSGENKSDKCPELDNGVYSSDSTDGEVQLPRMRSTRKRKQQPDKWRKVQRKRRRNSGKKYTSTSKKAVSPHTRTQTHTHTHMHMHIITHISRTLAHTMHSQQIGCKKVGAPCGCKCRCFAVISQERRKVLFDGFWQSASFDVQNAFICGLHKDQQSEKVLSQGKMP